MKVSTFSALAVAAAAALVLGVGSASSGTRDLVKVKYTTSFGTFGREAYAYVALDKGYFAQAGLDVSITSGLGTVSDAQLVASGQTDFSPGDAGSVVLARGNLGLPVKCVAPIQQSTLSGYFSYADSGIKTWKDFAGHTIGDTPSSTGTVLFPYIEKKVGLAQGSVSFVPTTPQTGPGLFAAKKIDIFAQFVVGKPTVEAAVGGAPLNMFSVAKVVPGLLGNCLIASEKTIQSNPTLVKRFVWALEQGLKWAVDNPDEAGQILHKYVPLQDPTVAAGELKIMKRYVITPDVIKYGYGYVSPKRVASTVSIVNSFFHPQTPQTSDSFWASGFQPKPVIKVAAADIPKSKAKKK
jgi:NitT/TauT family transport system substrate-binding protein